MLEKKFYMSNKRVELFITLITAASFSVILLQYVYSLNSFQMLVVYIFDFIVAIILAVDFYFRMKSSKDGYLRFFLRHWYEIPAMIPLFTFAWLESQNIAAAGLRALRLIRLLRLVQLSFRTLRIFKGTSYYILLHFPLWQ
jgi:voltage-gated potassium channel